MSADDAAGLIKEKRLLATLNMSTPLSWLQRHGEVRPLDHSEDTLQSFAIWMSVLKTWREMGIDMHQTPPSTMASQFGQVPLDGGDVLPFLISFRSAYESDTSDDDKTAAFQQLAVAYPQYADQLWDWLSPPATQATTLEGQCQELGWPLTVISGRATVRAGGRSMPSQGCALNSM